ncbi:MAG: type VI secretion system protein TssA [Alcaligenaceae bacterium]|nr:type VI secretion system protein TssA [Alcaligenaceae bacterium]
MSDLISARTLGASPISATQPAGINPRDGEAFNALQAQIDRLTDIHAGEPVEWPMVVKLATAVLGNEGKDLAAGTWLTLALFHEQGLSGLADGIHLLRDLIETHWDDMSPPSTRLRGRRNQTQWLLDQLNEALDEQSIMQMPAMSATEHTEMLEDWDALDTAWQGHDAEAPAFYGLAAILRRLPVESTGDDTNNTPAASPTNAATPASPAAAATPPPASIPQVAPVAPLGAEADITATVESALAGLHPLVAWFIQEQPTAPMLFRLNRICAWTTLDQAPAAQGRTTRLPAPSDPLIDNFDRITQAGDALAIIRFTESRLASMPLWLDLNRASHGALTQLGASQAAETVALETARLISRVPGLAELSYNDGRPFADPATQAWLQALQGSPAADGNNDTAGDIAALTREAEGRAVAGKLDEALTQLQAALHQAESRRAGFRLQLAQCSLIHRFDTKTDMRALVIPLIDELEVHHLSTWEPELARQAMELAAGIELRHGADHAGPAASMLGRLSRINVPAAWQLSQPSAN